MMKNLVSLVMVIAIVLVGATTAFADYPNYLGGNKNYILWNGRQGYGMYIDRNSLNVEMYNPPRYIIAIDWVGVPNAYGGSTAIDSRQRERFSYDWNNKRIYRVFGTGELRYIDPNSSQAEGSYYADAAEIAFYLAYRMKFLGTYPESFYDLMK